MKLHRGVLLAAIPLLLLAGWLFLYAHSHAVDTDRHNQTLALLENLKKVDSDWSTDVLRSHADINPNYDALAQPLARFAAGLAQLRARIAGLHEPALEDALARVAKAVDAKTALVDAFKAQNSLFKSSLRYVPTAHKEIQSQLRGQRGLAASRDLEDDLDHLVNESLRYNAVPDGKTAQSLRSGIGALRAASQGFTPQMHEPVSNLLSHLDTMLRLRWQQREMLGAILQVPVAADIDTLAAGFTQRHNAELTSQFRYQRWLLAYSAVALLLVITGTGFIGWRGASERNRLHLLVEEKTRELNELATRDELTRVHNRRHMSELLAQQAALHARSGAAMCVALLDIDLFKSINDRFGHAAGDAVLQRFAATARQTLRTIDLLGRWGGEEFLVALPQTSIAQGEQALQRMREAIANTDFSDVASGLRVTFSGGLVSLRADAATPIATAIGAAIESADQAMYRAKSGGRDRIEKGRGEAPRPAQPGTTNGACANQRNPDSAVAG